jgi:hypothetical protein
MVRLVKKKDKGPCAMPECGEPAKVAGMCNACYHWWGRVSFMGARDFGIYVATANFRATRTLSRIANRGNVKHQIKHKRKRKAA